MWNVPKPARLAKLPPLGNKSQKKLKDTKLYLHFFINGSDWYAAEFDGDDTFWGFVILNGDAQNAEWGYFSFSELRNLRSGFVEVDCEKLTYFPPRPAHKIESLTRKGKFTWLE